MTEIKLFGITFIHKPDTEKQSVNIKGFEYTKAEAIAALEKKGFEFVKIENLEYAVKNGSVKKAWYNLATEVLKLEKPKLI